MKAMKNFIPYLLTFLFFAQSYAQEVTIELFKDGFNSPVNLQHAGDDRLFVVEQNGIIKILNPDGTVNSTPFLDISSQVSCCGERGLLGLAFHPDYENNGYFYVNYTNNSGDTQVSRFSVSSSNADIADENSELPIIDYNQPNSNHNGGCLAFGPDGYLYISSGDGGGSGDTSNNAQNLNLLLGKMLRIDIDNTDGNANYAIPPDNPFIGNPDAKDEIWAYGLRNPWKFSFDSLNGDIWIGDVGQNEVEEIDRATATDAGLNYGWRCYEGSDPFNTTNCPPESELTFPIAEYSSATGSGNCSITGGYVYRGSVYADIQGVYIFADYCNGTISTLDQSGTIVEQLDVSDNWVSFGEDVNGELYAVALGGDIYKIEGGEILSNSNIDDASDISLVPNPASNIIELKANNALISEITITDVKGSVIYSEKNKPTETKTISVSSFSNGMYFVKAISENGNEIIKKLVIQ
ncbi:MAG: hypothetical protein CMC07_01250 [Flavobacteriaceae bacterium]|jgi:glucose/arabinose dehydrogenase|nr:hypothetical protein [Flavobacteriaceae bacterium]|tara:strand:- start:24471 stop:25865 length:1395 start_codon:yes stop_codon:yes gene_type:complete